MSYSCNAATFRSIMNLPASLSNEVLEFVLDMSIDLLNMLGCDLPNLGGPPGAKIGTNQSKERGAIFFAARAVYYSCQKDITGKSVGDISINPADLLSDPIVMGALEKIASKLTTVKARVG